MVRSGLDRNIPPAISTKPPMRTVSPILTTGSKGFLADLLFESIVFREGTVKNPILKQGEF
jgi:hypothetical protein